MLLSMLLVASAIWAFAILADEVVEGDTHVFDEAVLLAMRTAGDPTAPWGPRWFTEWVRDCTALGSTGILTFITLAVTGFLLLQGKTRAAVMVVIAVGGGMLLSTALKRGFDRPRPDLVPHGVMVYTASFPSGHAMLSAVVYLTLGALLARVQPQRWLKAYILTIAMALAILVGLSRIYLGVHWPTDVLAGWVAGAAWALMVWHVALWLQQRGELERDDGPGESNGAGLVGRDDAGALVPAGSTDPPLEAAVDQAHLRQGKPQHHVQGSRAMPLPVYVILNTLAGAPAPAHDDRCQQLCDLFERQGIQPCIALASSGREVRSLAQHAVQARYRTIVAGGGDGTINAVASALVGTGATLGILPLGTLNHFAKDLGIPLDLEGAVQTISAGSTTRVDVGEVNGHVFLNNSSLGLYPRIVRHRKKQQERLGRGKWPAFLWATLTMVRRYPFLYLRLCLEGESLVRRTPFVFIGNNAYQLDIFNIGARVCLDAGALSLYVPHRTGRLGLLVLALRALLGLLRRAKDFDALCVQEVRIATRPTRVLVATDGEVSVMETPLHYRIRPGALRVLVPR